MNVLPVGDRVVLKIEKPANRTKGGIALPDEAARNAERAGGLKGEVVAAGPGRLIQDGPRAGERLPMSVVKGNRVLLPAMVAHEVEVEGEPLVIVNDGDILAILE